MPLVGRLVNAFPDGAAANLWLLLALTPVWIFALYVFGLYREPGRSIGGATALEALNGLSALTAASWLVFIAMVFVSGAAAPVSALIAFWFASVVLVPLARWVSRATVWAREGFAERTLIVGAGEVGHTLVDKIAKHPEYRLEVVGFLDDGEPLRNGNGPEVPVLGDTGRPRGDHRARGSRPRDRRLLAGRATASSCASCAPAPTTASGSTSCRGSSRS